MSRAPASGPPAARLPLATLLLFALPALPITMMHIPVGAVIPGFYAKFTTASLSSIGLVFLVSRIFDALVDPAIGYASDRTRTRWGSRKPWIVAGAAIASIAAYFLFTPPSDAGAGYLMAMSIALYFGWGILEIPYRAWSAELTRDYAQRSQVSTGIAMMGAAGTILFMSVPLLPFFDSSEITPPTLTAMALVLAVLLPTCVALAVARVPAGEVVAPSRSSVADLLASLRKNRPLRIFSACYVFGGLATGVFTAVFFIFVDNHLGIGERFIILYVVCALGNLAAIPLWHRLSNAIGRHKALALSFAAVSIVQLAMAFVAPGAGAFVPMLCLSLAFGVAEAAGKVAPYALLGDVVDYEILRSGVDRGGSYFAALTLVAKLNFAIGGGVAFLLLGSIGYRVGESNGEAATNGFLLVFIGIPTLLWLAAAVVAWFFPLDRRRQQLIRARIRRRAGLEAGE
ncbi:MAG TPA: MFS transporter [Allosphingosinicella sp.]|jgi:Na+/melibiose symporter-like transporter